MLFRNFKQIPFEKYREEKLPHTYSLPPGKFEHFNINFDMGEKEEVSFFSLTNYRQTFPGIFIGRERTRRKIREVETITEGEKTPIPDEIPQIEPSKSKNLDSIDDNNVSLNSLVPYIISKEEQKHRWERLNSPEKLGLPQSREIYYKQENKDEYEFWLEFYNGEDEKENVIIIPLLNGKQVEMESNGKKSKAFHSVAKSNSLNHYPFKVNLDNEKRENGITLLIIRADRSPGWRAPNTSYTYIRSKEGLNYNNYNYSHEVKIEAKQETKNDENSIAKRKGIIELEGNIKIYEPHYCKNTGIIYIDYEIKHDKIEDERAPRFVARRQDELENIENEKYIASFDQEGKLVDTHTVKAPDGDLITYLGLHKIMLEAILFEASDELLTEKEKTVTQIKKRAIFSNYFDNISMEEKLKINNKNIITREAEGREKKKMMGKYLIHL